MNYQLLKRILDIIFVLWLLSWIWPFLLIIAIWVKSDSDGPIFYLQERVGKDGKVFKLMKFRTMAVGSDKSGLLTVGNADCRITESGKFLRKYKLDEMAQLFNILLGEMSIVGPRPEVQKYVNLYTEEQRKVLSVLPGLTDYASIEYIDEDALLGAAEDPEKLYVEEIMPKKLALNLKYIKEQSLGTDLSIIIKTVEKIVK